MLTRIRNAQQRFKQSVAMPSSKAKLSIAKVLQETGFITDFSVSADEKKPELTIQLKYHNGKPVIDNIKRISKPSLRRYKSAQDIQRVLGGLGVAIVSTSQGMMSDAKARKLGIGGEIIAEVA